MAGVLDELLDDPGFLLVADPVRLLRVLPAITTPAGRQAAAVYQLAVHQLRDRPIEEAAAYLELAARQHRADDLADRVEGLGLAQPWSARWAAWQPTTPHRVVGRHAGTVEAVVVVELEGRPIAVSGGQDGTVRVWDLRTGEPIGDSLRGHTGVVSAVAVGKLDGRPIAVSGSTDRTVWVWDLRTGEPIGEPLTGHFDWVSALALGELDGRPIAISGSTFDQTVRVWDLRTRRAHMLDTGAPTTALAYVSSSEILVVTTRGLVLLKLMLNDRESH
jgi:hypothetical protein